MNCPYCSKEMLCGYFWDDRNPIQWIPDDKTPSMISFTVADGAVSLCGEKYSSFKGSVEALLKGYKAQAYYCDECHIVIAKTEK